MVVTLVVQLQFSTTLPAPFVIYKVDQAGIYDDDVIPEHAGVDGYWVRIDNNTLQLFIRDNGSYDLDNIPGQITDPIVLSQPTR